MLHRILFLSNFIFFENKARYKKIIEQWILFRWKYDLTNTHDKACVIINKLFIFLKWGETM